MVGRRLGLLGTTWLLAACWGLAPGRGAASTGLRIVSYNIRHGRGMDDSVNLRRTGRVLAALRPDFVGLQEVDDRVRRSGGVDEAAALGAQLGMQHRFGSFMDYQGGRYGLAILSRHPIIESRVVILPVGNEPRVALVVDAELPSRDTVSIVTVHFDWVSSDSFRFPQASRLAARLDSLRHPYVLLGDFNDEPGSRTLGLFTARAREVPKLPEARFTFSSAEPVKEIDFVFVSPSGRWEGGSARAIDERVASDHRPVLAEVRLRR